MERESKDFMGANNAHEERMCLIKRVIRDDNIIVHEGPQTEQVLLNRRGKSNDAYDRISDFAHNRVFLLLLLKFVSSNNLHPERILSAMSARNNETQKARAAFSSHKHTIKRKNAKEAWG